MLAVMDNSDWFFQTRLQFFQHGISLAGIVAFGVCVVAALMFSSILQSQAVRSFAQRMGLEKSLAGIVTTMLGLSAFVGLIVLGVELGGIPIPWSTPVPAIGLSPLQIIDLVVMIAAILWLSSAGKRFVFNRFLSQSGLDRSLQYAVAQVIGYVIIVTGLIVAMQNVGINLSALTVFAGAVGVGVGLGLQNIASNFISGLVILAERPIKIGDRVNVDGVAGRVQHIRARATTVITSDNITMIVPNSKFIGNTVTNWTYGDPKVRFRIPVKIAYGSDLAKVREALVSVAKEHPSALAEPAPRVFFDNFGDTALNFELVVWSDEMSYHPRSFRSDLNFAIERKMAEIGVQIPVPLQIEQIVKMFKEHVANG